MALSDSSAEDSPNGHGNRVIKKQFDKRVLRVHFRMSNADRLVVTAYWTSKTKKYAS